MITLTIVSLSVGILTSITGAVIAVLKYLKERDKRENFEKLYIDIKTKFEITQQNTQQVKNDVTQAVNLTTQINISEEDRKKIAELLLGAVTLSRGTLAIDPAPPIALVDPVLEATKRIMRGKYPWHKVAVEEKEKDEKVNK